MAVETFGSGINSIVSSQLQVRSNTVANSSKDRSDLLTLNSNTAWIKVRSSVNEIIDTSEVTVGTLPGATSSFTLNLAATVQPTFTFTDIKSNPTVSKNTKLEGNNLAGVGRKNEATAQYRNTSSRGFVPKPGITNFSVSTKNTYGTLRQAKIDFTVWSLEDLTAIDKVYFRPGYSVLVEWGHSVYKDNSGNLVTTPSTISDEDWFNGKKSATVENKINANRINSGGNYDGFFGYVYNFSWSFRADGGYDCSIEVVSKGIVLESIKVGKTVDFVSEESLRNTAPENASKPKPEDTNFTRKSIFHYLFESIEKESTGDAAEYNSKTASTLISNSEFRTLNEFKFFRHKINTITPTWWIFTKVESTGVYYIKLQTFLEMFNEFSTIFKVDSGIKRDESLVRFDTSLGETFITHDEHYSVDPLSAVPPKPPKTTAYSIDKVHPLMQQYVGNEYNDIMNIMVCTGMLKGEIDKVINSPQEEGTGFFDAFKGIISRIQSAFAEINDFDIIYDELTGLHRIVDRKTINKKVKPSIVNITGLKSTLTQLQVVSKISNQIASQISIAAQGTPTNYGENVSSLLQWNQNTVDRFIPSKVHANKLTTSSPSVEQTNEEQQFTINLILAWNGFNGKGFIRAATYGFNPELMENIKQESISRNQKLLAKETIDQTNPPQGTVPVELHLKMLGISGMKIGNTFRVSSGVLPSKYKDYGFIITGLSHSIENGKWYTDIKTQFFSLK